MTDTSPLFTLPDALDAVVRGRRTAKRFADPTIADGLPNLDETQRTELRRMLESAGHAPFHRRAHDSHRSHVMPSPVPWRFHVLERDASLMLYKWLRSQAEIHPESSWSRAWSSKIPALLGAAGALVIVTWLPDPSDDNTPTLTTNNVEHIAAASAATQNLLLLAEAAGWSSYWSSGGVLRDQAVFEKLTIPNDQKPIGAIMLAPADYPADKVVPGGLHDQRGTPQDWMRYVSL